MNRLVHAGDDAVCLTCGQRGLHVHDWKGEDKGMVAEKQVREKLAEMTDAEVVERYRDWSEEVYAAGVMTLVEELMRQFLAWLRGPESAVEPLSRVEQEMVSLFRRMT